MEDINPTLDFNAADTEHQSRVDEDTMSLESEKL